ncbi:mechanosensitive ion channel protein [Actinocatenispora thailandica]|uniref:Mechanosensitive ion channel protein n=1 Tax=Actinocatenispora thailandica TaxID=227318 RepID=A0A7R7HYD1_9ACTN|nr:mechanosensitive ion channel family protein [Actinocatenispora thailandica]BCJ37192.1 mechanosensitive ion channel protein [Actinocatenispora thailandica]
MGGSSTEHLLLAGGYIIGGILVALLTRLVFGYLKRRADQTRWAWDDIGLALIGDLAAIAAVSTGLWLALHEFDARSSVRVLLGRALVAAVVLAVTLAVARSAGGVVRTVALGRSGVAQSATIFVNVTRVVVMALGLLLLLQSIGVSITPLLTALGVGGLAVALALQDTLSNLFAGIHILASRKVQPGDYVQLDSGEGGYVEDINWRNTTIRQLGNNLVIVPNARFADALVTNYQRPMSPMSVLVPVGVAYDSDLDHVERVTVEVGDDVMRTVEGGVPDHEPSIRYHTFGDSSIEFNVILRCQEFSDQYLVTHEFIKRLHRRYGVEGIEIPFPIRTVVLANQPAPPTPNQRRPELDDPAATDPRR